MNNFLIDSGCSYKYDRLLQDVNEASAYRPVYQQSDLYLFYLNLITAIASGREIVLIDADLSIGEMDENVRGKLNRQSTVALVPFKSFDDLVTCILTSNSEITFFTSGSTGQPKQIVHNIQTLTRHIRLGEKYQNNVWGLAFHPAHMAGIQVFMQALLNKNSMVNLFAKPRDEVAALMSEYNITHLSATPTFYRMLLPFEVPFDKVERISIGGEKSNQSLIVMLSRFFPNARVNNIYASTEAGTLLASHGENFSIPPELTQKIRIIDNELLLHRSLLSSQNDLQQEYYATGDMIEWVDEKKAIFRFASRKNELLNVGGFKVNPHEVENILLQMPGISQVLVYCKPNSVLGNILCADVVLVGNEAVNEFDVRKYCQIRLQDFKIPRKIYIVERLSTTRTGKIKRV